MTKAIGLRATLGFPVFLLNSDDLLGEKYQSGRFEVEPNSVPRALSAR